MIPFREETLKETGKKHRTPWDFGRANAKLQEFNREEIQRARIEDVEKAKSQGIDVDGERLSVLVEGSDGRVVVDPHRAKIHHAGVTVRDRTNIRWRKFCSVPQNDESMEYPMPDYEPKEFRKGKATPRPSNMSVEQSTEKRRPGRPRKQEIASI